jgi:hypothetical protein
MVPETLAMPVHTFRDNCRYLLLLSSPATYKDYIYYCFDKEMHNILAINVCIVKYSHMFRRIYIIFRETFFI